MITEDFVSYEVAKLLKEKGFDERCEFWFAKRTSHWGGDSSGDRTYIVEYHVPISHHIDDSCEFLCYKPTLQMAMKWLREKYGLFIQIWILSEKGYWFNIDKIKDELFNHKSLYSTGLNDIYFPTYEEATENAIKYCLENLIEK